MTRDGESPAPLTERLPGLRRPESVGGPARRPRPAARPWATELEIGPAAAAAAAAAAFKQTAAASNRLRARPGLVTRTRKPTRICLASGPVSRSRSGLRGRDRANVTVARHGASEPER